MRATIKDIAAATGFSVTTISLVLNGKGYKISDETKNQILAKARELNYRPNQLAVSLVKRQSKTIGFIVPDISNVYFANMARAIDEACRENGWSVILCNTNDNYDRDREYIDLLADKGADGIVFIMAKDNTREMAAEEIDYLESIHIPYVVVDRIPELRNCPAVGTDHEIGGYLAARHLLSLGHRRIACVVGPHATQMDSEARYHGYCRAMEEAGIPVDERLSVPASIRRRVARRRSKSSFHRILRRFSPATTLRRMAYAENSRNIERKYRKMFRLSDTMTFSMHGCWRCR